MHATESQLALLQTGELGLLENWRVRWHVRSCERCGHELAVYEEMLAVLEGDAGQMPAGLDWQRMAAEMTANIHLGVAAGECVRPLRAEANTEPGWAPFSWKSVMRPALGVASLVVMLYAGTWMLTKKMENSANRGPGEVVLEARPGTLEIRSHGAAFSLVRASMATADVSVGTGGSLQARDVDDSGQVTIYHVYAQ